MAPRTPGPVRDATGLLRGGVGLAALHVRLSGIGDRSHDGVRLRHRYRVRRARDLVRAAGGGAHGARAEHRGGDVEVLVAEDVHEGMLRHATRTTGPSMVVRTSRTYAASPARLRSGLATAMAVTPCWRRRAMTPFHDALPRVAGADAPRDGLAAETPCRGPKRTAVPAEAHPVSVGLSQITGLSGRSDEDKWRTTL